LVCVAALTISACGGGYAGLSKAEFVKQALAICAKSAAKVNKIMSAPRKEGGIAAYKQVYAAEVSPALDDAVARLRALKPPKADRKTISKMLDHLSTGIDQYSAEIASLKSDNEILSLPQPPGLKAATKEAKAYGIGKCIGT